MLIVSSHAAPPQHQAPQALFPPAIDRLDPGLDAWRRPPRPALQPLLRHYVDVARAGGDMLAQATLSSRERLPVDFLPTAPIRLAGLRAALTRDIARLLVLYRGHTQSGGETRIRLERETDDRCRFFHTDRIGLRLLCTYCGPGTEWLPEEAVNRGALGSGDNRAIASDDRRIERLRPYWVGFFKGDLHPDRPARGCVHRSPPIRHRHGLARILLTIDDPSDD
jgi:hypothetical protein